MHRWILIGGVIVLATANLGCQGRGDATAAPNGKRAERVEAAAPVATPATGAFAPAASPVVAAPVAAAPAAPAPVAAAPAVASAPVAATTATPAAKRPLRHGCTSADQLMTKLLAALEAKDLTGMNDIRITREEHDQLLWPEFDAKDRNVQPDFAWDMLNRRSHVGAGRAIGEYGGQELTLLGFEFTRGVERYPTFVLHRGTLVHARTTTGEMQDFVFCGSVLELDGQFKFLSYRD